MGKKSGHNISRENIRELWDCYIDIQYQLLQQRSQPILIDASKTQVRGSQVVVLIDDRDNDDSIKYILDDVLGQGHYEIYDDYILVDSLVWASLLEPDKQNLSARLKAHYVDLDPTTSITAIIQPNDSLNQNDEHYTLDELKQIDKGLCKEAIVSGQIDEIVACIAQLEIDEDAILGRYFGDNYTFTLKESKQGKEFKNRQFVYHNSYIPQIAYDRYKQEIGLEVKMYVINFQIEDVDLRHKIFDRWENLTKAKNGGLKFTRKYESEDVFQSVDAMLREINRNIHIFLDVASQYSQPDKIKFSVDFHYKVDMSKVFETKKTQIEQYVNSHTGLAYQYYKSVIGIDFNWKSEDILDICRRIENDIQDIKIIIRPDHKYKCKICRTIHGIDSTLTKIEESFMSVSISRDEDSGNVIISLPYSENSYTLLRKELVRLLSGINDIPQLTVSISSKPNDRTRLKFTNRNDERIAEIERNLSDLGKADIGIEDNGRQSVIAKLMRVKFPYLFLDISVSDNDKAEAIKTAFEQQAIHSLIPMLTGDIEKINRLKETFSRANSGDNLLNDNLQNFVFDSSKATPTFGIEDFLREDGSYIKEIEENLLNSKINISQKIAIVKAVQAEDLAIIQGPPGTGKSTAIAELIWQLIREGEKSGKRKERILLTSETNLAVDNAIARCINERTNLVKPVRFGDEEKLESEGLMFSMDLMKKWVEEGDSALVLTSENDDESNERGLQQDIVLKNWLSNICRRSFYGNDNSDGNDVITKWRGLLSSPDLSLRAIVYEEYLKGCNVIGATCSSIGEKKVNSKWDTSFMRKYNEIFSQKSGRRTQLPIEFTTVIQDESSKATPAELVLPLVYGQKSIIIGDHRQLPPMLDREEFEDTLDYALSRTNNAIEKNRLKQLQKIVTERFCELEVSHFQRLYEDIDDSLKGTFNLQYRMHPAINEVIKQFYVEDGGLACGLTTPQDLGVDSPDFSNSASRYHGIDIPGIIDKDTHVLVVDVTTPEMKDGTSRVNHGEVTAVDQLLTRFEESESFQNFLSNFSKEEDRQIGLISFYGKQIRELRSVAKNHSIPVRVSTVDRFQGMERNIVIVSMVRSNTIKFSENSTPDYEQYPDTGGFPEQSSLGFAESPNRLNVALSRAKRLLVIVGNRQHFSRLPIYKNMYETIESSAFNNKIIRGENL